MAHPQHLKADRSDLNQPTKIETEVSQFEIQWKPIETHKLAILTVRGKDTEITQRFEDGQAPFFTPMEEGLKPGRYAYQIEFIDDRVNEESKRLATASTSRRELLSLRKKLMEEGDREGARRLIKKANEIRQKIIDQPIEVVQKSKLLDDFGFLIVKEGGQVSRFNLRDEFKQDQKRHEEKRANEPPPTEKETSL